MADPDLEIKARLKEAETDVLSLRYRCMSLENRSAVLEADLVGARHDIVDLTHAIQDLQQDVILLVDRLTGDGK